MTEREKILKWLKQRYEARRRLKIELIGIEEVEREEKIMRDHFKGKSGEIIILDDLEEIEQ